MIRKIQCTLTLLSLIVRFKLIRPDKDFWSWLLAIVSNQDGNNKNKCIIWFLLSDALGRKDDRSVCILFERLGDNINILKLSQQRINEIEEIFNRTGNQHLVSTIHAKAI